MSIIVETPFQNFTGLDGKPLTNGKVYIGQVGTDPTVFANQIPVFWDEALTIPASQPLTTNAGYIVRFGTPARVWVATDYSMSVKNSSNVLVYYVAEFGVSNFSAPSGASLIGYPNNDFPITVEKALDILYYGVVSILNPKFSGGADPTGITDSTIQIQAAVDYWIANGGLLHFPHGSYQVDMITIKDAVYNHDIQSDGAIFSGNATTSRAGVFDVVNCVDFNWFGSTRLVSNNNSFYDRSLSVRAQAGTSQSTTRCNFYNISARNFKVAYGIGQYDIDFQCSEINFFGCSTFKCPTAVYCAGSQTGASFSSCNLVSEKNAALTGAINRVIWMEGGFITIVGGEVIFAETAGETAILLNPCKSTVYGNLYPIIRITGAHIETQSQLMLLANNRGLFSPNSLSSNIAITNCGGYVSGNAAAQDFIFIGDSSYVGALSVKQCNFYSDVARTAYNISSSAEGARISVDQESFSTNFKNWFGGIFGGTVLHEMMPIFSAYGIGITVPSGAQVLNFQFKQTAGVYARYSSQYSAGNYVSSGNCTSLQFISTIVSSAASGDFYLRQNGVIVAFGRYTGIGQITATVHGVSNGDVFNLVLAGIGSSTFDSAVYQSFEVWGSTLS